jgi:branched-chain amino acid transport system substrate-binding protein
MHAHLPLTVGAVLSLHGSFALQGQQAHAGLALWAADVNAAGGLAVPARGRCPIALWVYDDASRSAVAATRAEQLIVADQVDLLLGPYGSGLTHVVAAVAARYGKVLWNHGGAADILLQPSFPPVVTLLSPAHQYFVAILELLRQRAPTVRRVALVGEAQGSFAPSVLAGAAAWVQQAGWELVLQAPYPRAPAPFEPLVQQLHMAKPDIVLGVGRSQADLAFAQACRTQHLQAPVLGLVATPLQRFQETLGRAAEGCVGPSQWEAGVRYAPDVGPTAAAFAAAFRARYQMAAEYPAAQAYAAGLIAAECIRRAGSLADAALWTAARQLAVTTFYGGFQLDPGSGAQIGHAVLVVQWQGEQKRIVWPPEQAEAELALPAGW